MITDVAEKESMPKYLFTLNFTDFVVWKGIMGFILILGGISYLGFANFLLFHSIVELICISIGIIIMIIAINMYPYGVPLGILILGLSYGCITIFDGLHVLSYKGMGVIESNGANLPTQFWIIARYMESLSTLAAMLLFKKRINFKWIKSLYLASSLLLIFAVFHWGIFPNCFIEGVGLTPFKITSEYIISGILLLSVFVALRIKSSFSPEIMYYMMLSIISTIISEFFFTLYMDVYDLSIIMGHNFRLISYYFMYKGIIEVYLKEPYKNLEKSEKLYRILFDSIPTGVIIHSKERIQLVNNGFMRLLGETCKEKVLGTSIWEYFNFEDTEELNKIKKQLNRYHRREVFEKKLARKDGAYFDTLINITPYTYEDEPAFLITVKDITATKQVEYYREEIEEKTAYQRLQQDFFANLSHELKTPINLIFSIVQLLEVNLMEVPLDNKNMKRYMRVLRQNCYRMLRLINNLIDITKMDSGYLKLCFKNYNIINVVEDIVLSTAEYMNSKGINLLFDTDVEEKIMAIDAHMIERVILNLLSNAIKFTDPGGEIVVNIENKDDHIIISVTDTGIGIPKEKQKIIFDRFGQVDRSQTRNRQGSGLGLSLAQSIIEMHGGNIHLKSECDRGSEFVITLPVQVFPEAENPIVYNNEEADKHIEMVNVEFSDIYA